MFKFKKSMEAVAEEEKFECSCCGSMDTQTTVVDCGCSPQTANKIVDCGCSPQTSNQTTGCGCSSTPSNIPMNCGCMPDNTGIEAGNASEKTSCSCSVTK